MLCETCHGLIGVDAEGWATCLSCGRQPGGVRPPTLAERRETSRKAGNPIYKPRQPKAMVGA